MTNFVTNFVICERGYDCGNKECSYTQPTEGGTMTGAKCGHINKKIDIIEYQEVATSNPNFIFKKRKRHGL